MSGETASGFLAARLHLGERRVGDMLVADGLGVEEGLVGEVEQVVDQELVVALQMQIAAHIGPVRVLVEAHLGDFVRIRQLRVAHPDPGPLPAVDRRKLADGGALGNRRLAGNADARPTRVEGQAVIAALQLVAADHPAEGKGGMAVTAAILEGHRLARLGAVEDHRLAQQSTRQRFRADLVAERGHIPVVA